MSSLNRPFLIPWGHPFSQLPFLCPFAQFPMSIFYVSLLDHYLLKEYALWGPSIKSLYNNKKIRHCLKVLCRLEEAASWESVNIHSPTVLCLPVPRGLYAVADEVITVALCSPFQRKDNCQKARWKDKMLNCRKKSNKYIHSEINLKMDKQNISWKENRQIKNNNNSCQLLSTYYTLSTVPAIFSIWYVIHETILEGRF